jgi:hypothetical protein
MQIIILPFSPYAEIVHLSIEVSLVRPCVVVDAHLRFYSEDEAVICSNIASTVYFENIINKCAKYFLLGSLNNQQSKFIFILVFCTRSVQVHDMKSVSVSAIQQFGCPYLDIVREHSPYQRKLLSRNYCWRIYALRDIFKHEVRYRIITQIWSLPFQTLFFNCNLDLLEFILIVDNCSIELSVL